MDEHHSSLIENARNANGEKQIRELLDELNKFLEESPEHIRLLEARALLHTKLERYGQAINDYRQILQHDRDNRVAAVQIEHLTTILRYRNTDIFENPNTHLDPWLE